MKRKKASQVQGLDPLTVGLAGVLILAAVCSWQVYRAADSVINLAVDPNTYVTLVVEHHDGTKDIQADNEKLANEVNEGRARLQDAQGQAVGMMVACGLIGCGLTVRLFRRKV